MNSKLSFPEKLLKCLYDIGYYAEVLKKSTGYTIKFGIMMALFFGSLTMIRPMTEFSRTIDAILQDMDARLKVFTIEDGVMNSTSEAPYALNMQGLAVVVDPSAEETSLQQDAEFGFYLTKTKLVVRSGFGNGQSMLYKDLINKNFGKEELKGLIDALRIGGWVLIPLGALYGVIVLFFSATVTMFYGRLVYAFARKPISYRDSFVVAVHAQALSGFIMLLTSALLINIPYLFPLCLFMMGMYYIRLSRWDNPQE